MVAVQLAPSRVGLSALGAESRGCEHEEEDENEYRWAEYENEYENEHE